MPTPPLWREPPLGPPRQPGEFSGGSQGFDALQKWGGTNGNPVIISQFAIENGQLAMDQYLLIPFLGGWTSINRSYFDVHQGYKVLTHCQFSSLICVWKTAMFHSYVKMCYFVKLSKVCIYQIESLQLLLLWGLKFGHNSMARKTCQLMFSAVPVDGSVWR